jgi:hypothetical protein
MGSSWYFLSAKAVFQSDSGEAGGEKRVNPNMEEEHGCRIGRGSMVARMVLNEKGAQ